MAALPGARCAFGRPEAAPAPRVRSVPMVTLVNRRRSFSVAVERMAGDEEADRLALVPQLLLRLPRVGRGQRRRRRLGLAAARRRRGRSAGSPAPRRGRAPSACTSSSAARAARRFRSTESNAPQAIRLSITRRFTSWPLHPHAEVVQAREAARRLARRDDRLDRLGADAVHRAQAEADRPRPRR